MNHYLVFRIACFLFALAMMLFAAFSAVTNPNTLQLGFPSLAIGVFAFFGGLYIMILIGHSLWLDVFRSINNKRAK